MKNAFKAMAFGIALAAGVGGAMTAAPAAARTEVFLGVGNGYGYGPGPGYYRAGYREDWRGYRGDYRRWDRRGYRDWDRRGWRGDNGWRGGWRGGYRERCWTEWRRTWDGRVPVRICR